MRIDEFAEMLRELINESHNPIYNDSLLTEIEVLEWVQRLIQNLVNNKRKKIQNHK
jgi:hypothetical protein